MHDAHCFQCTIYKSCFYKFDKRICSKETLSLQFLLRILKDFIYLFPCFFSKCSEIFSIQVIPSRRKHLDKSSCLTDVTAFKNGFMFTYLLLSFSHTPNPEISMHLKILTKAMNYLIIIYQTNNQLLKCISLRNIQTDWWLFHES